MFGTLVNSAIMIGTSLAKDAVVGSEAYQSFQSGFVNPLLSSTFGKGISNIFSGPSTSKALAEVGGNLTKAAGESVVNQLLRQGLGADPSDLGSVVVTLTHLEIKILELHKLVNILWDQVEL